jgi:hypothetical protein
MSDERKWVADLYDGDTFIGTVLVGDALGMGVELAATCREFYRITDFNAETKRAKAHLHTRERVR